MYQQNMRPAIGALRRTLAAEAAATPKCSSRALSVSARRLEEANNTLPSAPASTNPESRKARSANALKQISRLGANRRIQPGGLAKGNFPSGQTDGQAARGPPRVRPEGGLKITRQMVGPDGSKTRPPPPAAMARAPAQLKLSRNTGRSGNTTVGNRRGPNLRGRDGKASGGGNREQGPKRRERKSGDEGDRVNPTDVKFESTLSDGMVRHLLRLQRGEWDRKPYVPKYAPGSFEANQLVHAGRELFRGEAPPVKIWGMLEKRIGVVGMHNAEAHLKVRRVADLDNEALGERRQHFETGDVEALVKAPEANKPMKAPAAPAANAPAPAVQAVAAKAPAPKRATVA